MTKGYSFILLYFGNWATTFVFIGLRWVKSTSFSVGECNLMIKDLKDVQFLHQNAPLIYSYNWAQSSFSLFSLIQDIKALFHYLH